MAQDDHPQLTSPPGQLAGCPRYSVLLVSRNEGDRLRKTVDDVLRHGPVEQLEVVVVDDHSDDNSTAFLNGDSYAGRPIRAFRNSSHRGLIYSRARAAQQARGEYLAFLDAHCGVSPGWLESLAGELRQIDGRGLVSPAIYKLRPDWTIDEQGGFAAACTISTPFFAFAWTAPTEVDGKACTCVISGGAWMCRAEWYRHIGGLDGGMRVWGLENIDVPLRTWTAGGWCLAAEHVKIGHLFEERPTVRRMDDVDYVYNKIRAVHNVFSSQTFTKIMDTLLHVQGFREALTRVYNERKAMTPFKDYVESIRQRSDAWLMDTFKLPLLESPAYHLAPRRPRPGGRVDIPRPSVDVVLTVSGDGAAAERCLSSLVKGSSYGNYEVLLVTCGDGASEERRQMLHRWKSHPRVRMLAGSASSRVGLVNEAAQNSDAQFLALAPEDTLAVDEHWMEEFLLLAERRPRLLMACPRTCWGSHLTGDSPQPVSLEELWDWQAPGFLRERVEPSTAAHPYQVLSCPDTLLFFRRQPLLQLGGFDPAIQARLGTADLALHGWLAGLEVFCHPGIEVRRGSPPKFPDREAAAERLEETAYSWVVPAVKYFTSSRRQRCRARYPRAHRLLRERAADIEQRRRDFLAHARFDDDWLFFKFNVESSP